MLSYRSIYAMLPTLVLALGFADSVQAESVTGWVMIFDNGDGIPFVGGSEATSSPVLGRADKNSIAAHFNAATLVNDGDFVELTGSMSVDVNLANNQFRWGLFEGPATLTNPVADPTGYTGFSAMSAAANLTNGSMGSVFSGTAVHPFAGAVTTEIQVDPTGTAGAVVADTALGFMMRVTKNGANVDVTASLVDPLSDYDIQYSVSGTPASPGSFTYDTAAFLFGGSMNGSGATFSNIEVATGNTPIPPKLTVNRDTGLMTLATGINTDILGYSITSVAGALDQTEWITIAGHYDAIPANGGTGNGLVDIDDNWTVLSASASNTDLSEAELVGGDGGSISVGLPVDFGNAWVQYWDEDVEIELLKDDGTRTSLVVEFVGGTGEAFPQGDFDFNGLINKDDYILFLEGLHEDVSMLSVAEAYQDGDMNEDLAIDFSDVLLFEDAYVNANGPGSFAAMAASIPEPSSCILMALGCLFLLWRGKRN